DESNKESQASGTRKARETLALDRLPRDLMLRGKFEEATPQLVAIRGELKRQRDVVSALNQRGDLEVETSAWRERAIEVANALTQAQEDGRNVKKAVAAAQSLERAKEELTDLDRSSQKIVMVVQAAAAEPMSREVAYLLALCKHEQAERAQGRYDLLTQKSS